MKKTIVSLMLVGMMMALPVTAQISGGSGGGISGAQYWKLVGTQLRPINALWSVQMGSFPTGFTNFSTSSVFAKGDIIVAPSSTAWTNLAVGTNGYCLKASSTSPTGLEWGICSASVATATTTINGVAGPDFTFNVIGNNGFSISTSTGIVSFSQATSSATQSGFLSSTDWGIFNAKENAISWPIPVASTSLVAGTGLDLDTNTINTDFSEFGTISALASGDYFPVWQDVAGDEKKISWDSLMKDITYVDNGFTGLLKATSGQLATSTPGVDYVATSTGDWAGTWQGQSSSSFITKATNYHYIQWTASYTSSTQTWFTPMFTFPRAATITRVIENSTSTGNNLTYNLYYSTTNVPKESMYKVFSSDRTLAATSAPTSTTVFSSSTPAAMSGLWIYQEKASSTDLNITIEWIEQ